MIFHLWSYTIQTSSSFVLNSTSAWYVTFAKVDIFPVVFYFSLSFSLSHVLISAWIYQILIPIHSLTWSRCPCLTKFTTTASCVNILNVRVIFRQKTHDMNEFFHLQIAAIHIRPLYQDGITATKRERCYQDYASIRLCRRSASNSWCRLQSSLRRRSLFLFIYFPTRGISWQPRHSNRAGLDVFVTSEIRSLRNSA